MQRLLPPRCSVETRPEVMVLLHRPSTDPPCLTDRVAELSVSGRGRMGEWEKRGGVCILRLEMDLQVLSFLLQTANQRSSSPSLRDVSPVKALP
ncbi:hypothetical protein CesoFtcFv8_017832 [Champsocephalus esox]|uniref:Uncharacterized protein n=1 Tax=Champsocephalus esox TaxID=159716 RepID=A0AAN8BKA4_9TELE|nr:hypothetical protein CesoFtcFv8_017832 [Champsocephalus esox]